MKQKASELASSEKKNALLTQLETYRQSQLAGVRVVIFLIIVALLILGAILSRSNNIGGATSILFLGVIIYFGSSSHFRDQYKKKLKQSFLPDFIKTLWPNSKHFPVKGMTVNQFNAGRIFLYDADFITPENLIEARGDRTSLRLSEITASCQAYGAKNPTLIFKGLFLIADFNKNTKGRTYVLPDKAEKLLGRPGQSIQALKKTHGELVKTEDPEFEKQFAVFSTDQIEARYILSPSFMRNLLEFRKQVSEEVYISFIDGKMYLGLSNGALIRNIDLSTALTPDNLTAPFADLIALHKLTDRSLNTRIWTKE